MAVDVAAFVKRPTVVIKFIELILGMTCCFILGELAPANDMTRIHVVFVTLHGYLMVNIVSLLSYLAQTPMHRAVNVTIAVAGASLFLASGGIMIDTYNKVSSLPAFKYLMTTGAVAIVNGLVYLVDAGLSFKEAPAST